jgi:hypothetical protein
MLARVCKFYIAEHAHLLSSIKGCASVSCLLPPLKHDDNFPTWNAAECARRKIFRYRQFLIYFCNRLCDRFNRDTIVKSRLRGESKIPQNADRPIIIMQKPRRDFIGKRAACKQCTLSIVFVV